MRALAILILATGCGDAVEDDVVVMCGAPTDSLFALEDIEALDDCTHFLGSIRIGDTGLTDFLSLPRLREIDGSLVFFRNDAVRSMRGLEALEIVHGNLGVSHHALLADLDGLASLRVVGGDFYIRSNTSLHDAEAHALAERVTVGGSLDIRGNAVR
jgi:hypothetical protein